MDLSIVVATVGALLGVGLGGWLSALSDRRRLYAEDRRAEQAALEGVYTQFLVAYRQFYRFLVSSRTHVTLVARADGPPVPVIDGAEEHWRAIDEATARGALLAGDRLVVESAEKLATALGNLARARAGCGPGEVPTDIIAAFQGAQGACVAAARSDLRRMSGRPVRGLDSWRRRLWPRS